MEPAKFVLMSPIYVEDRNSLILHYTNVFKMKLLQYMYYFYLATFQLMKSNLFEPPSSKRNSKLGISHLLFEITPCK